MTGDYWIRMKVSKGEQKRRAKRLQRGTDICDYCDGDLVHNDETRYRFVLPDGLSREALRHAFENADTAESERPSTGQQRRIYALLGVVALHEKARDTDGDEQIVVGRAMDSLGGHILAMHPECAEEADVPSRYRTPGWED